VGTPRRAFFASGACHVLAFRFAARHPTGAFGITYLRPNRGLPGSHVYATDGTWAFDFNGWVDERDLLAVTEDACSQGWPGWSYKRIEVTTDLEAFCEQWNHRPPRDFPLDVIARAESFLDRLLAAPPRT
jgi:hypothetical protein